MATSREYAYFIKGSKIAIVERDLNDSSGLTAPSSVPAIDLPNSYAQWKSPQATATDALEIEYVYSPKYTITTSATTQVNKFYINGWTIKEGYLTFLRSHSASVASWDASPYSAVGDGEYIVINGSNKWNGLHKVKAGGTDGTLQTHTRVNQSIPVVTGSSNIDIFAEEDTSDPADGIADRSRIAANNSSNIWLNNVFSTGDYIFVSGSEQAVNNGFWKISDVQADSSNEIDSGIYVTNRYYCYNAANTLSTEGIDIIPDTYATYDESVTIYKAYRDFCYLQADVDVLEDESDTIDIPPYLAKALVYYVKGRIAEDALELEISAYAMTQFRKMLEKHENSKVPGPRRVMPGSGAII